MNTEKLKTPLAIAAVVVFLAVGFIGWVYSELTTAIYALSAVLLVLLVSLAWLNQKSLRLAAKTRSVQYGANALITVALVVGILVVLNFLNFHHYYKTDLTRDKKHSLSQQTVKILKDMKTDVKLTAFAKAQARDQMKALFNDYRYYAKKLEVEFVDPDRDKARAVAANIKEYNTVVVTAGKKETRIQEPNEEKLTNALVKVLKEKTSTVCFLAGHGERNPELSAAEGYTQVKKELSQQNYTVKVFTLYEAGKVPADCDVLLVLGPSKAFFEKEIEAITSYLDTGGRALFALDPNIRGGSDETKELKGILEKWNIEVNHDLIIDPSLRMFGASASVPMASKYSTEHPITKDFQLAAMFPLASSLGIKSSSANGLKTWWLAKSSPQAFAKSDFKEIATGQVRLDPKKDKVGDHELMVAVEGTQKKVEKKTRIVAMGTSALGSNAFARHGANIDLFLNAVSWLVDDEDLISIRAKEAEAEPPSLTQAQGRFIQLLTMILIPGTVLATGTGVWFRRRKL